MPSVRWPLNEDQMKVRRSAVCFLALRQAFDFASLKKVTEMIRTRTGCYDVGLRAVMARFREWTEEQKKTVSAEKGGRSICLQ